MVEQFFNWLRAFLGDNAIIILIILIIALLIYLLTLLSVYYRFLRRIESDNITNGHKYGLYVGHSFKYSWKKGVSLEVVQLNKVKKDDRNNGEHQKEEE
jgi:hypothetical protein